MPSYVFGTNATSNFSANVSVTADFFNGTTPADRCVLVFSWSESSTTNNPDTCTYNGVSMTAVGGTNTGGATYYNYKLFALLGDDVATGSVTVTAHFDTSPYNNIHGDITVQTYSGVDSTAIAAIIASVADNKNTNNSPTWSPTCVSGDLAVVVGALSHNNTTTYTPGTDVTKNFFSSVANHNSWLMLAFSKPGGSGATAIDGTFSATGGSPWLGVAVSLPPAPSGATTITLSGPGNGTINVQSASFNFGVDATPITGTVVVTPASDKAGTWQAPGVASLSTGNPTAGLTFTPSESGVHTITTTNDGGLTDSTPLSFSVASAYTPYNVSAIFQPTVAQ